MARTAKIAEFKAHLSAYLKQVRRGGTLIIMDRDSPVAKVVPIEEEHNDLRVHPPLDPSGFKTMKWPRLKKIDVDVVKLLREDRDKR